MAEPKGIPFYEALITVHGVKQGMDIVERFAALMVSESIFSQEVADRFMENAYQYVSELATQ